jgi:uncharacterized RDD family membrane protein YckC
VRQTYRIQSPENVTFEFELAGVASRALAWGIDVAVMVTCVIVVGIVGFIAGLGAPGIGSAVMLIGIFVIQWWYAALLEWLWGGRTVGKRVAGLRTLDARGGRITFFASVVRNLLRVVDLLPGLYLVGGVSALLDRHGRRLGDIAAGTIVVRERRAPRPTAVVPAAERYNTFISDPEVLHAARRITPPERDALIALGLRREEMSLPLRRELFQRMSAHLERRLGVRRPAFFSEEKFVLNLTAAVLGQAALGRETGSRPGQAGAEQKRI